MSTRIIQVKKMIPKLRFSAFSNEWSERSLGDVFIRTMKKNDENNLNVLTISAQQGLINQEKFFTKSVSSKDLSGYYLLKRDDFAYNKSYSKGYPMGAIKRLVRYESGVVSPLYICFRINAENQLGEYFEKYFDSGYLNREINKIAQEGARNHGLLNMSVNEFFNDIKINIPDLAEQKKIAEFLGFVDIWIANLREQYKNLENYKNGIFQGVFSQKIVFKDDNGKEYPKWKLKKLKDVLFEHKTRNVEDEYGEVFSVAKGKGIINQMEHLGRSYASDTLLNYKVVFPGDIVYTKSPTAGFPFGIIKQNRLDRIGVVSTLYAVFRPVNKYAGFLLHEYFLSSVNTFNYLNPLVHKGAKNTMNIGNDDFLNGAVIHLPISEDEQRKVADFLISIDKQIESKRQQIAQVEQWKKGLMQQMFI